ncbi:hypothetical protein GWI33_011256, partial [Rhynchophorus ferrugineus]
QRRTPRKWGVCECSSPINPHDLTADQSLSRTKEYSPDHKLNQLLPPFVVGVRPLISFEQPEGAFRQRLRYSPRSKRQRMRSETMEICLQYIMGMSENDKLLFSRYSE